MSPREGCHGGQQTRVHNVQGQQREFDGLWKGKLKGDLVPVFDCLMAGYTEERDRVLLEMNNRSGGNGHLFKHGKFKPIKTNLVYRKGSQKRDPEGLWNLHPGRYSKLDWTVP